MFLIQRTVRRIRYVFCEFSKAMYKKIAQAFGRFKYVTIHKQKCVHWYGQIQRLILLKMIVFVVLLTKFCGMAVMQEFAFSEISWRRDKLQPLVISNSLSIKYQSEFLHF